MPPKRRTDAAQTPPRSDKASATPAAAGVGRRVATARLALFYSVRPLYMGEGTPAAIYELNKQIHAGYLLASLADEEKLAWNSSEELLELSAENKRIAKMYKDADYDLNDLFNED